MYNNPWMQYETIDNHGRELRKKADAYRLARLTRRDRYGPMQRVASAVAALFSRTPAQRAAPITQTREVERIRSPQADLLNRAA
ncbi:MAG: hypothetical protein IPM16_22415 [Chloroflexi bacterium]|nr:hypothetical protein [Chloroflexota bacterium]